MTPEDLRVASDLLAENHFDDVAKLLLEIADCEENLSADSGSIARISEPDWEPVTNPLANGEICWTPAGQLWVGDEGVGGEFYWSNDQDGNVVQGPYASLEAAKEAAKAWFAEQAEAFCEPPLAKYRKEKADADA